MRVPTPLRSVVCLAVIFGTIDFGSAAQAGGEAVARASVQVQTAGPRGGEGGKRYLNVQGKDCGDDGKYATFGIIDFPAGDLDPGPGSTIHGLELSIVQSVPAFAKDGKIKVYLTTDLANGTGSPEKPFRFDRDRAGGAAGQLKPLYLIGSATFTKKEDHHADLIPLDIAGEVEQVVRDQVKAGGTIRLVLVPDDPTVAATYFGAGAPDVKSRPRLIVKKGATPK